MCMFIVLLLSRIVLSVHMPLVPVFCIIVAHSSLVILCIGSHPCNRVAVSNVMRLQIPNGDSDRAVGQWVIITIHI